MSSHCWGIFRERAHSPGRENDDTEILRLTGKHLEARGYQVDLKDPEDVSGPIAGRPRAIFLMCEREEVLAQLAAWERDGIRIVNSPAAVLATYRERMIAQFDEAGVPFVKSRLVATPGRHPGAPALPVWVKRGRRAQYPGGRRRLRGDRDRRRGRTRPLPRARDRARRAPAPRGGRSHQVLRRRPGGRSRRRATMVPVVLPQGSDPGWASPRPAAARGTSPGGRRARSGSRSTAGTPSRRRMAASCSSTSMRGRASPSTEKRPRLPSPPTWPCASTEASDERG
jgi:hypothetical protein